MPFYSFSRSGYGTAAAGSMPDAFFVASSTSIDRLVDLFIAGEASAAQFTRNQVRRDSSNGAGPSAITATKVNPRSGNPGMTAASGVSGPGSLPNLGGVLLNLGLNNFGGQYRWVAAPNEEIYLVGGTVGDNELSVSDALNRAYTQSLTAIFEEL